MGRSESPTLANRRVISFPRQDVDAVELRRAFDRYRAAAGLSPDAPTTPELAEARTALTLLLIRDGWAAPAAVSEQLAQDQALLDRRLQSVS